MRAGDDERKINNKWPNIKFKIDKYLLECNLFNIQYVDKSETSFDIFLNNHRKDVKNPNAISADKHFSQSGQNFNNNSKITLNEMLTNTKLVTTKTLKERQKNREDFWMKH